MSRPDEGMIHAWLDGELTPEESAELERRVASDPAWAAAVAEARGLMAASSRIVGALDAVPGRVIPGYGGAMPKVRRSARGFQVRPWMGLAAGLVLTVGTALVVWSPESVDDVARVDSEADAVAPSAPVPPEEREVSPLQHSAPPEMRVASGAGALTPSAPDPTTAPIGPQPPAPAVLPVAQPPLLQPSRQTFGQSAAAADMAGAGAEPRAGADDNRGRVAESEIRRQRASQDARAEVASAFAGKVSDVSSPVLSGCWRAAPPFTPDTLLRDLTIASRRGDTLVVALSRTRQVTVTQRGDTLSGELSAIRTPCPSDRSPDPE